jgi:hypothetical protein
MLADLSKRLRVYLALMAGATAALYPVIDESASAWARRGDDDDDDEDEDEEGESDEDEDDSDSESEEEDEDEDDPDQPKVTAGGLFTLKTYPQGEIQRPLTMTKGIQELRAGIGFDISNQTAFETFGASFDYRYGYQDNVELQAGIRGIQNFDVFSLYGAFEGSIVYDLVDFRTGISLARTAETTDALGNTVDATTTFGIPIGFPFRYAPKEQVAVVALETAFEIQFDSKPDATPNIGIIVQPAPIVAILVKASLRVADFDFSNTDAVVVPATIAVQLSPNNKLDAGMEFTFNNMKPPEGVNFYDSRFLLFFGQLRL